MLTPLSGWRDIFPVGSHSQLLLGTLSSLIASVIWAIAALLFVSNISAFAIAIVSLAILLFGLTLTIASYWRILRSLGIISFYNKGQKQYAAHLVRDILRSDKLTILAARGQDMIGEDSTVGETLRHWPASQQVEVFLLDDSSSHVRVRNDAISAERAKYKQESVASQLYVKALSSRFRIDISLFLYDERPWLRAVILSDRSYVSIYRDGIRGRNLPCILVRNDSVLFWAIDGYLSHLRRVAYEPKAATS